MLYSDAPQVDLKMFYSFLIKKIAKNSKKQMLIAW